MRNLVKLNELHDVVVNLDSVYSKWAKKYKITKNELCILNILLRSQRISITQKDICNQLGISFTTLNSSIKLLIEKGYVFSVVNDANKKERLLLLTEPGVEYAEDIINPMREIEEETAEQLKLEDIECAIECLRKYQELLNGYFDK